jgi:tetratricopeptide (TPR) repeat protein
MSRLVLSALAFCLFVPGLGAQSDRTPAQADRTPAQADRTEDILKQAIALHQAGNVEAAIPKYEAYLKLRPGSMLALANLGAAYAHIGRYEDAIAEYKQALAAQPGNSPIELNLALAYYKSGRTEDAAAALQKVRKAAPEDPRAPLLLADCWLAMGRNKDVIDLISAIAERQPDDLAVAYLLGTALVRDNQVARGQVIIDKILRNGDSAEARLLLGTTKLGAMDFPGALQDLTKAVELNPKLPDVYSYYGLSLLRTGDAAGAQAAFTKELASNPNDFNANLQMGVLLKQDENYEGALKYLRHALDVRPGDLAVRYQIASIHFAQGATEKARGELESIVKESPKFTEAHVTLATVYYRLKRKQDGDREKSIVATLTAEAQAKQPGVNVK